MIKPIIHISGASGSGKTFLGKKLKDLYRNRIIVIDIDDIRTNFIKEHYGNQEWDVIDNVAYQEYIDNYIHKKRRQNKPIIFVGLNNMPWWHPDLYYNFYADNKFYIDIDDNKLVKQKCMRYLTEELKDIANDEMAIDDMINNNTKFIRLVCEGIKRECDIKEITEYSKKWKTDYESQGYMIASGDEIYERVVNILDDVLTRGGQKIYKKSKKNRKYKSRKSRRKYK